MIKASAAPKQVVANSGNNIISISRMYVIGLLKKQVLSNDFQTHLTDEDRKIPDILGFNLNLNWESTWQMAVNKYLLNIVE